MASKKSLVILGGSYGGVSIAHYLLKHAVPQLPEKESYEVVIKLFVSIAKQFEQYPRGSVRFIHGTATTLNHTDRVVTVSLAAGGSDQLPYHSLVIATGASTPSPLLGLNQDVADLRASWAALRTALPHAKCIVIAGGGPAGVETAGELGEHLNGRAGWGSARLANPKVAITVVTAAAQILPALRPALAQKAEDQLAKVGVTVVKHARVVGVAPPDAGTAAAVAGKTVVTLADGKTMEADLYIPATGMRPNAGFVDAALKTADGRVDTNAETLRVDKAGPRVYAVGDVGSYARPAVHLILNAIPVLGANIKRDLLLDSGKDEKAVGADRVFKEDTRETQMVPIGKSKAVGAAMGFALPSLMVWLVKGRDYWLWTTGSLWSGKQWAKES